MPAFRLNVHAGMLVPVTTPRRVRREPGRASLLIFTAVAGVVMLAIVGFVASTVGREIGHRTDSSWHYERITLTQCSALSQGTGGISYFCTFATVPPLPFAIEPYLDVTANGPGVPRSTTEWVHVVRGRIVGTDGRVPLWVLAFLIIPVLIVAGVVAFLRSARRARRGRRNG